MSDVNANDYWTSFGELATFVIGIVVAVVVYLKIPHSSRILSAAGAVASLCVVVAVLGWFNHRGYDVNAGDGE